MAVLDEILEAAAQKPSTRSRSGCPTVAAPTCWPTSPGKRYAQIFREFEGAPSTPSWDPATSSTTSAVPGSTRGESGEVITVSLAANPSHLEAVNPVLEGIVRASRDSLDRGEEFPVLPVLMHGDAAFAGQGVVAETLNLSQLRGYRTGGTLHIIVNNQVGFTTPPESSRSSVYATDVARTVQAPSSTSTATTRRRVCGWRGWPSTSARRSTRTWSSTWSATGAAGTTRPTTRR